ncbi:MAG: NERD domain-containing protein [Gammaproteobacteria bacterium]|nr:NERD domain-containing protein [Gammaproteobacteria bacterium]
MQLTPLTVALIALVVVLLVTLIILVTRRRSRSPEARLRAGTHSLIGDTLIPDGEDGEIHLTWLALCTRGIVVIDTKHADGNVFGSDTMQEWAVLTGKSRRGFPNPQDALYDRVAAVKRLASDVPVHGYIAFTGNAEFSKGVPSHVVMFDALAAELEQEYAESEIAAGYLPVWEQLKAATRSGATA